MKCRNYTCDEPATGYARIYHEYKDPGPVLDADWAYCDEHLIRHANGEYKHLNIQFFYTLNGIR